MKIDKPYPYNLLDDIFGDSAPDCLIYGELPPDNKKGLYYVLSLLTERERGVLNCYYDEGMTIEEIGKRYGVTRERVRQILAKALRKTRHPSRWKYISRGYEVASGEMQKAIEERRAADIVAAEAAVQGRIDELLAKCASLGKPFEGGANAEEIFEDVLTPIENLDLSVRSFNCLNRAGVNTVYDIANMEQDRFYTIRNLGKKSAEEIIERIHQRGYRMAWEK